MLPNLIKYNPEIENIIFKIANNLNSDYSLSSRSIALLLIQQDEEITELVRHNEKDFVKINDLVTDFLKSSKKTVHSSIINSYNDLSNSIAADAITYEKREIIKTHILNKLTMNPLTGIPILLLVIYFGFYKFVGTFAAGFLVDYIENSIFEKMISPFFNNLFNNHIKYKIINDLFVNDYGIITMGIKYAIAIVLPIVLCFFIVFSIIEDSGYLPRISLLLDRVFKKIGLNGRAVIPMTLGFGCDTMATMVSRTLETKRERIITTFLLSLTIPCSAQLGVILSILSSVPNALFIWTLFMVLIFLLIGYLTSKVLPGENPDFFMEIPPLRLPKLYNVIKKTYTRIYWYLREILPLFVLASVIIWLLNITGIFELVINLMIPIVNVLDLPASTAEVFVFGFFRRDYGAAGLYTIYNQGLLSPRQLVVSAITLTLFIPCIAQFIMTIKERGLKAALYMAAFIIPFSFISGFIINKILLFTGII